jgi:(p)ppGpp synthase/HD superfamily hydrolase
MDQLASPAGPASSDPLLAGLLARITSHRPDADRQLITRGYQAAAYWHRGQQRKSGDPYLPTRRQAWAADTCMLRYLMCRHLLT